MSSEAFFSAIKKAAVNANEASQPMAVLYGTVKQEKPLEIRVNQKMTLKEKQLHLTHAVRDYEVDIEVSHYTVSDAFLKTLHDHPGVEENSFDSAHKHACKGRKKIKIYNGLKEAEEVILLRYPGGQEFLVLDRVKDPITEGEWI